MLLSDALLHPNWRWVVVAAFLTCCACAHSASMSDVTDRLLFDAKKDPLGNIDTFQRISSREAELFDSADGRSLRERIASLASLEATVYVDVKLVCFDGDGMGGIQLQPEDLVRYLDQSHLDHVYVIESEANKVADLHAGVSYRSLYDNPTVSNDGVSILRPKAGGGVTSKPRSLDGTVVPEDDLSLGHRLSIENKLMFTVHKADPAVCSSLSATIRDLVLNKGQTVVDSKVIDDSIGKDFTSTAQYTTIYLLNLRPPVDDPTRRGLDADSNYTKYAYRRGGEAETTRPGCNTVCDMSVREPEASVSNASETVNRGGYIWYDLTAGPLSFGPRTIGEGVVTEFSMPRVTHHVKDGKLLKDDFAATLAAWVRKTTRFALTPVMSHFPVPYVSTTVVDVIHFTTPNDDVDAAKNTKKIELLYTEQMASELKRLALPGQSVLVRHNETSAEQCEFCYAALAAALRSHSSTVVINNNDGGNDFSNVVHRYLDSKELRAMLQKSKQVMLGKTKASEHYRHIPVFIFDMDSEELILLDRFHQAVAFPDMIVAVTTRAGLYHPDVDCASRAVTVDSQSVLRPVLAAVLETGWGVAAIHHTWDPFRDLIAYDYTFATTQTPFGELSDSVRLSFNIIDTAHRNVLLSYADRAVTEVHGLLSYMQRYDKDLDDLLTKPQYRVFSRRWQVFVDKLRQAFLYLSLNSPDYSLYYLRSMWHDIRMLHRLVYAAGKNVNSSLTCLSIVKMKSSGWFATIGKLVLLVTVIGVVVTLYRRGQDRFQVTRKLSYNESKRPWHAIS